MKSRASSCIAVAFAVVPFAAACSSSPAPSATDDADTGKPGEMFTSAGFGNSSGVGGSNLGMEGGLGALTAEAGTGGAAETTADAGFGVDAEGAGGIALNEGGVAGEDGTGGNGEGGSFFALPKKDAGAVSTDAGTDSGADATGEAGPPTCKPALCGTHSWACWPMPNASQSGLPNGASYTDLHDGTVRDDYTCLRWQRDVTRNSKTHNWADAKAYCEGLTLGGVGGWRVPTRIELISILDMSRHTPAIALESYPSTPPQRFWTSSGVADSADSTNAAWYVEFQSGETDTVTKSTVYEVRCVQGNGEENPAIVPLPNHYAVVDPGEIRDNFTGLVWQQADSQNVSMSGFGAAQADQYCAQLQLNGHAWRLPSMKELATLVDDGASAAPMIDGGVFATTASAVPYWSSTVYSKQSTRWTVSFRDGTTAFNQGTGLARCVR